VQLGWTAEGDDHPSDEQILLPAWLIGLEVEPNPTFLREMRVRPTAACRMMLFAIEAAGMETFFRLIEPPDYRLQDTIDGIYIA